MLSYKYGVVNDVAASGNFMDAFTNRLMDASSLSLIVIALYYKTWSVFLLLVIGLIYFYQFNQATIRAASFLLCFGLLYSFSLFFVYLGTPHDLLWHLATSAERTTQPVFLAFMACSLILFVEIACANSSLKIKRF
jgi:hypothetical protein